MPGGDVPGAVSSPAIMRLAFVKQKFVPFGGGEGYLSQLMAGCSQAGHDVHLITTSWGDAPADVTIEQVEVLGSSTSARARGFSRAVCEFVRAHPFDLVFSLDRTECQDVWRAGEGVHLAWLDRRREFDSPLRLWMARHSPRQRTFIQLERQAVANARLIVANSTVVKAEIERWYEQFPPIRVIHNGVDLCKFSPADRDADRKVLRREWQVDQARPLIVFVGSGYRRKGLAELLHALRKLRDFRLVVIGRDDPRPWRRYAARAGVAEQVTFRDAMNSVARAYRAADVLALPGWYDAFPNVCVEALACGTPVVTTRYTGAADVVEAGVNGGVIDTPAHIDDLAAALQRLVADPPPFGRVAASVQHLSMDRHVEATLAAIEEVAGTERNNPA